MERENGLLKPDPIKIWKPGEAIIGDATSVPRISDDVYHALRHFMSATVAAYDVNEETDMESDHDDMEQGRSELDTHANMIVVGCLAYIIADVGKEVDVSAFSPDLKPIRVPLVDAAIHYEDEKTGKSYILVVRNAIWVKSMTTNLIPPFIMREAGITVNDVPKIQVTNPTVDDHSIVFQEDGFRIPLSLWGVFSYFPSRKPTRDEMLEAENVYLLTPTVWNPHSDAYANNEEAMVDSDGNIRESKDRTKELILAEVDEDSAMAATLQVSSVVNNAIDEVLTNSLSTCIDDNTISMFHPIPWDADETSGTLTNISCIYSDQIFVERLEERAEMGRFQMSIGATDVGPTLERKSCDDHVDENIVFTVSEDEDECEEVEEVGNEFQTVDMQIDAMLSECLDGHIDMDDIMAAAATARRPLSSLTPERLSKIWRISEDDARRTLNTTTQRSVRREDTTIARNYGTNDRMLRYKRLNNYFFMDTFFATSKIHKSTRGNTCCQLFVTDKGFVYVVPMKSKSEVPQAVKQFAKEVGAPEAFVCDPSGEQSSKAFKQFCTQMGTTLRYIEEGTPWANKAELYIGLIKEAVRKDMLESNAPLVLWDYCVERRSLIHNLTARNSFKLQGQSAYTDLTGEQGDISNICQYGWYEWVYFWDQKQSWPLARKRLGRVLGPARGQGNEMCQYIMDERGNIIPRRTLRKLRVDELHSKDEESKRDIFTALITKRYGSTFQPQFAPRRKNASAAEAMEYYTDGDEESRECLEQEDVTDHNGKLLNQQPMYDVLLHSELLVQNGDNYEVGKVARRALGHDGQTCGTYDPDPFLNTMIYEVELPDGSIKEVSANVIAENILTQVDDDGFSQVMLEAIVDFKKDATAVDIKDKYVYTRSGQKRLRKTTTGWSILVRWRDQTETWVKLKDLKDSHPVELAEFAKARSIADEPAFAYWVPYTLRKRDVIISSIRKRLRKTTHKYGIEIPRDLQHAKEIDASNGNTLWQTAYIKEMKNVGVAFEILPDGVGAPIGWHKVTGHLIWDVKMDFTRKARWVLDGHKTADQVYSTYAGVVSRESVRIALTYAALNKLNVCAADIQNAYIQAPSSRKDYIIYGPEFGLENVGKVALIHRAVYGGKTAGRDFRNHLRSCMRHLNFISCPADPDVWMRPAKKADGTEYYEYVLLYTDDALVIAEDPERILRDQIGKYFKLKENSIGPPQLYLGGNVRKVVLDNGVEAWAFGSSQYVKSAVKSVQAWLSKGENQRWKLPKHANTPMRTIYRPELDISNELTPELASYYQSLIGMLRWMCELGRVDICLEISMMSAHLALPREGHLEQVFHMFSYLNSHHNAELIFDPTEPDIDMDKFQQQDWTTSEFGHVIGKEVVPSNCPQPRGQGFIMSAMVDADHAADSVSRRSRTGFLVYLNSSLVYWHSKKQTSIESSSFGSEFCAMKNLCEYLRGLRYKLRMMGIPVEAPVYISGDNQSVLANTSIPDSILKKKSQSIAYHYVREGVARDEWRTSYVNTALNWADLLTKMLPYGEKRRLFVRSLLQHVYRSGHEEPD